MLCLLATIKPCIEVFSSNGKFRREPTEITDLRAKARKAFFDVQPSLIPYKLRLLWSVVMLLLAVGGILGPVIWSARPAWNLEIVVTCFNSGFLLAWIVLITLNLSSYKPQNEGIKGSRNAISYFAMEQIHKLISEICLYPTPCLAAIQHSSSKESPTFLIGVAVINCFFLLVVFIVRVYTIVQICLYVKVYFARLIFSLVTNYLGVIFLLVLLLVTSPETDFALQIVLFVLVLITNIWNLFMFYISHLYEITLQSCVNVVQLLEASESRNAQRVLQKLKSLETFHKNMYAMSLPGYGTLLYFWIFPSVAVTIYTVIAYLDNHSIMIPVVVWFFFNAAINYKTLLLSCSAHFTSFVILIFFTAVCVLFGAIAAITFSLTVVLIVFACICKCFFNQKGK